MHTKTEISNYDTDLERWHDLLLLCDTTKWCEAGASDDGLEWVEMFIGDGVTVTYFMPEELRPEEA